MSRGTYLPCRGGSGPYVERKLLGCRPEVRERISRQIELGPIGQQLKRANEFKCQLCEALGFRQ